MKADHTVRASSLRHPITPSLRHPITPSPHHPSTPSLHHAGTLASRHSITPIPPYPHTLFLLLSLVLTTLPARAQNVGSSSLGIQSPTAASLGKFGETPVNYYTGQATVTIPLFNLESRHLAAPVALQYNGGQGIRVEETPGWVGMGWALEAGGVITRTMRGLPDDRQASGYLDSADELLGVWEDLASYESSASFLDGSGWSADVQAYIDKVNRGEADPEPDAFYFNFAGRSGQLVMESETEIYTIPNMPYKIEVDRGSVPAPGTTSTLGEAIREIAITIEDGTKYIFGTTGVDQNGLEFTYFDFSGSTGLVELAYVSSWYLTRIESAAGADAIDFSYTRQLVDGSPRHTHQVKDFHEEYIPISLTTNACIADTPNTFAPVENYQHLSSVYLTEIATDNGMTAVFSSTNRTGYMEPDFRKLDKIEVKGRNNGLIRSFDFTYDLKSEFSDRLLLTSVEEKGEGGAALIAPYTFSYYGEGESLTLPGRFSNDVDHRGYFNKAGNTTDLSTVLYEDPNGTPHSYLRGSREPEEEAMKVGVLKTITYPTGGYTEFEYEGHLYGRYVAMGDASDFRTITEDGVAKHAESIAVGEVTPAPVSFSVDGEEDVIVLIDALFNSESGVLAPDSSQVLEATPKDGQIAWFRIANAGTGAEVYYYEHEHDCSPTCPEDQEFQLNDSVTLSTGDYELEVGAEDDENGGITSVEVNLDWVEYVPATERLAGGLRIKQIAHKDDTNTDSPDRVQRFVYESTDGTSSGVLSGEPRHYFVKHDGGNCVELFNSTQGMSMLGVGQEIGYSRVEEFYALDNSEGWTERLFFTADEGPKYRDDSILDSDLAVDLHDKLWPFGRLMSLAYKRGATKENSHHEQSGGVVARTTNAYFDSYFDDYIENDPNGSESLTRLVPALAVRSNNLGQNETPHLYIKRFYVLSARHHTSSDEQFADNDSGGLTQILEREYFYDNDEHLQLTKFVEKVPSRSDRVTEYKYAHELSANAGMKTGNMLAQRQWSKISEGTTLLRKNWTEWKSWSDGYWRPEEEWVWKGGGEGGDSPSVTVADKVFTFVSYDAYGNPIETEDPRGTTTTYVWGEGNSVPTEIRIDSGTTNEQVTTATYDTNYLRIEKVTDPAGVAVSFAYDAMGRLDEVKNDVSQLVTAYNYNLDPNYVETISYGGSSPDVTSRVYVDGFGDERQTHIKIGSDAIVSALTLDKRGRLEKAYKPYEPETNVTSGWGWFHTGYDFKAKDFYSDFVHDNNRPYGLTEYESDPLSRVDAVWPEGVTSSSHTLRTDYGVSGSFQYRQDTDENGRQTTTYSDGYGNIDRIEAPLGAATHFEFDVLGQLNDVESPEGLHTAYEYDERGRLTTKATPDAEGDYRYKYDKSGNLRFVEDPNHRNDGGKYLYYKYDTFNRLTEEGVYTGSTSFDSADSDNYDFPTADFEIKVSYEYGNAQLQSVSFYHAGGSSGSYSYSYDSEGRIAAIDVDLNGLAAKTVEYEYDRQGRIAKILYEDNQADQFYHWYDYDEVGRLEQVKASDSNDKAGATEAATYSYLPDGQVATLKLGSSSDPIQTLDYGYHIRSWLASINDPDNLTDSGSLLGDVFGMELDYEDNPGWPATFDSQRNGNIAAVKWSTRENDVVGGERAGYAFSYDALDRLIEADYHAYESTWTNPSLFDLENVAYDKSGNITSLHRNDDTGSGSPWTYTYTVGTNRLASLTDHGSFGYDANGNITSGQLTAGETSTLAYDRRNLPESISVAGVEFIYRYDHSGQRIYSSAGDGSYYIRGLDGEVLAVYDNSGTLVHRNILAGGRPIGRVEE